MFMMVIRARTGAVVVMAAVFESNLIAFNGWKSIQSLARDRCDYA
jgi:hypothetical protein